MAKRNFEIFNGLAKGQATLKMVTRTRAGVDGWARMEDIKLLIEDSLARNPVGPAGRYYFSGSPSMVMDNQNRKEPT